MKSKTQLIGTIAIAIASLLTANGSLAASNAERRDAIRPFHFKAPEEKLVELRRRIAGDAVAR